MDAISLSVFFSRIEAVCDEMGAVLKRVAFSPNIKDRLDFSCAVFDPRGELCAQAAHIPVHLGSMAYAMQGIVSAIDWHEGDMVIMNDPYLGGTHLPDVTVIAPLFVDQQLAGFVVNRAHHADIGAESPGSMPISKDLHEEGLVIPPTKMVQQGEMQQTVIKRLMQAMRNPVESMGDFTAQVSANKKGLQRLEELVSKQGVVSYLNGLTELNEYAQRLAGNALSSIPDGEYFFEDVMDDDGQGNTDLPVKVNLIIKQGQIRADFTGTSKQVVGNINCPLSVAAAAVYYVFRCLMPAHTPACAGSFRSISINAPEGCLVNASRPAAVAAGNVETSTRIVDVVMGALAKAIPNKMAAASHGSMNNIAMGSVGDKQHSAWDYYETIGGGMGASMNQPGLHGVQTHMTNTLNTPVEALEMRYPIRINQYALRRGSGGDGRQKGGDGLVREYEFLSPAQVTLLTERRTHAPWGLQGAASALSGENALNDKPISGKVSLHLNAGDRVTIKTPGGGGANN
ncbi:MAG: hydantoinase B/oxoprolinase family protein [Gammaproteobacteria bacterium]|nr:hydantoinase B/oxoprolinase family protein [Gammaproteobacteria bacterium]